MLNTVSLMGRICNDLELRSTTTLKSVISFTLAVDRGVKTAQGDKITDFIRVVAWEKAAEFIAANFRKGSLICITGSIQTSSFVSQSGENRLQTEVNVNKVFFTGERHENGAQGNVESEAANLGNEDDLPF